MSRSEYTSNHDETLYLLDFLKKIKRRRQRYYTDEERVAAKRRRDAEYRARQRLKKLQVWKYTKDFSWLFHKSSIFFLFVKRFSFLEQEK